MAPTVAVIYSDTFAERLVANLANEPGHCKACGPACDGCKYGRYSLADDILAVEEVPPPESLPPLIEDPERYLPQLPEVDVLIAVKLHPDLLLALPEKTDTKAILVPVESPDWIDRYTTEKLRETCEELGIECEIPRPACTLDPNGPTLERLCKAAMIGKPMISIEINGGVITDAETLRSAPCGCTWYVAKSLVGVDVDPERVKAAVSEAHHSFPCTASMDVDPELGDTLLHVAGRLHIEAVLQALEEALG